MKNPQLLGVKGDAFKLTQERGMVLSSSAATAVAGLLLTNGLDDLLIEKAAEEWRRNKN